MSIDIRYEDQPQNVTVRVTSAFEAYTGMNYDQVAEVFPLVEDDDEDRSVKELDEC